MAGTNHREVIIGAAALGLTGISPIEAAEDAALLGLGADLGRLRKRCHRLARQVRGVGDKAVWARWSAAIDEKTLLLERIARTPARGVAGVAVKMQAVLGEMLDDDVVMDEAARLSLPRHDPVANTCVFSISYGPARQREP